MDDRGLRELANAPASRRDWLIPSVAESAVLS